MSTTTDDAFRDHVRDVLSRHVLPYADDWEACRHIPRTAWATLGGEGLLSLDHHGDGFRRSAILLDELGATGYAGIRAAIGVHAYMAASYLEAIGTAEQRDRYLSAGRRGERIGALAITESAAGSDLRRLTTRAVPHKDGYLLNGEKQYVSNGSRSDFLITLAATGRSPGTDGLASANLLLVDASSPGITRTPQPLLGWHAADVCRVMFVDVVVPRTHLVGRPDRAILHLLPALDFERLVAGLLAAGGLRHCLDMMHRFVRHRRVGAAPLAANQAVRHRIADLDSEYELIRRYAEAAIDLQCRGALDTRTASILKLRATELAVAAARTCIQLHGAQGYLDNSDAARVYRDAAAGTIAAGASEIMRDRIFESAAAGYEISSE